MGNTSTLVTQGSPESNTVGEMIAIHQQFGIIQAYLTVPQKTAEFKGAVIVLHELWGLTEHIKRVADRLAAQGYYALAPDLYSGKGVNRQMSEELQAALFSENEHVRYEAQPKLRAILKTTQTPQFTSLALNRLASCFEYMYNLPLARRRVAIVGFGLGGTYAYSMAIHEPRLRAIVPFYGHTSQITAELRHIACPVLAFYGGKDTVLSNELNALYRHMRQANVDFTAVKYTGSGHAFFNDTNPFSYRPTDAADAWQRSVTFLRDQLG